MSSGIVVVFGESIVTTTDSWWTGEDNSLCRYVPGWSGIYISVT